MSIKKASRLSLALAAALAITVACDVESSNTSTPTTPAPPTQLGVTGRWSTDITVQGVSARMEWTLTQSATSVSGPVLVSLANGIVLLNGSLTGTVNGSSMPYTITVTQGNIPAQPTCAGQFGGTMTVAAATMSGSMALVSSNCSITFPANSITLTKQ
jgi:hypothetical protein